MEMATKTEIEYLRSLFSPFDSSITAVSVEKIEFIYELFSGKERGIVHPKLIFAYLTESKPMPKTGFDSVTVLMSAR